MKLKKVFGVLAVLLALTVTACNNTPAGSGSKGGQTTSALPSITVTAAEGKKSLLVGETVLLTASVEGVTWQSANAQVATVDQTGLVTAVALGSVSIKAVKDGYRDGSIPISVVKPAAPHPAEPTWPALCPDVIDTSAWTAGEPVTNSYGKNYTPLTGPANEAGVKIALSDYDPASPGAIDSSGKITPQNEAGAYVNFCVKAPKAGVYQMILKASVSDSGDAYPFAGSESRGFDVKINGYEDQDNVYGSRLYTDANLDHNEKRAFVFALVQLNGPDFEDEISFRNPYYRLKFDLNAGLIFAENA